MSSLEVPESARKAPGQNTTSIVEVNSMNTPYMGTYLILPCSQEPGEQCPINRAGIGHLAMEESGVESRGTRKR